MENWSQSIQQMIDIIDRCIRQQEDEALTLRALSAALGYSESYVSRKFRVLSGMSLRDYFAASALQGLMANNRLEAKGAEKNIPEICYGFADAMLAERNK